MTIDIYLDSYLSDTDKLDNGWLVAANKKIALHDTEEAKLSLKREMLAFMKENELSQYEVGKICNLPAPYINKILSLKKSAVTLDRLCEVASQMGLKVSLIVDRK